MSRENDIEEMTCENCLHHFACLTNSEYVPTPCPAYEDKTGYRKQSEGKWVDQYKGKYANPIYVCSLCGKGTLLTPYINELNNMEMTQALSPVCPNCGAKMKGGAE